MRIIYHFYMMNRTSSLLEKTTPDSLVTHEWDLGNISISNNIDETVDQICYKYIGPLICIVGIICNTLSVWILSRKQLRDAPYMEMKTLAIMDVSALTLSFPFMVFCIGTNDYFWRWYEIYVFIPLVNFFTASSMLITVLMTIERYISVKYPLWARWRITKYNTQCRIWFMVGFAIFISVPRLYCYEIIEHAGGYTIQPTEFRLSTVYYGIDMIGIIFLHFLPFLILSAVNTYLIYELRRAKRLREKICLRNVKDSKWQSNQRRLTVTLVAVVLLSILSIIPATVADICIHANLSYHSYRIFRNIGNLLLWCNLSFNFILQCIFNKHFLNVTREALERHIAQLRCTFKLIHTSTI